ncbi:FAD/NAD(P)-binding domain-containing protein [Pisolithus croceorrhizus]|nr:FAD/NAD(P)-binding domain-containing protein [Pisolithus croceorrhizus]
MNNEFDVIIVGTGLTQSMAAAALAKAGLKVAHVDPNAYYGGDEAALTLDEVATWAERHSSPDVVGQVQRCTTYTTEYCSTLNVSHPKQYTISLSPSVIPAIGPFITSIIASGVSRYCSFRLLGPVSLYHGGQFKNVPRSKEDVFRDQGIPLIEKRRLMRFLMFVAGDYEGSAEFQGKEDTPFQEFLRQTFSLSEDISQSVVFALAYCSYADEPTASALSRVRSCLQSTGRYGPSPFIVAYYGGSGDLAQAFCRAAAVNGSVYILGRRIANIACRDPSSETTGGGGRYALELDDFPEPLYASCLLSSQCHVPDHLRHQVAPISSETSNAHIRLGEMARGIVVLDSPLSPPGEDNEETQTTQSDSFIMVFPPGSVDGGSDVGAVHVLTAGPGTMCTPAGKCIVYLSTPLCDQRGSPKALLEPYLAVILSSISPPPNILFQTFYTQRFPTETERTVPVDSEENTYWTVPVLPADVSHAVDYAAQIAEKAFWKVTSSIRGLDTASLEVSNGFWVDAVNEIDEDSD